MVNPHVRVNSRLISADLIYRGHKIPIHAGYCYLPHHGALKINGLYNTLTTNFGPNDIFLGDTNGHACDYRDAAEIASIASKRLDDFITNFGLNIISPSITDPLRRTFRNITTTDYIISNMPNITPLDCDKWNTDHHIVRAKLAIFHPPAKDTISTRNFCGDRKSTHDSNKNKLQKIVRSKLDELGKDHADAGDSCESKITKLQNLGISAYTEVMDVPTKPIGERDPEYHAYQSLKWERLKGFIINNPLDYDYYSLFNSPHFQNLTAAGKKDICTMIDRHYIQ